MRPERFSRRELLATLRDIGRGVANDDSLEGSISWALPEDPGVEGWDVTGAYRIGNNTGQGGMIVIGTHDDGDLEGPITGTIISGSHNTVLINTNQALGGSLPTGMPVTITLHPPTRQPHADE